MAQISLHIDDRGRGLPYKAMWLPHSNSDAVFSMVGLNKTKTRNSLALDGTLLSVMTVIYVGVLYPCHQASKCATNIYNRKKET